MPQDACLNAREVAQLFGYTTPSALHSSVGHQCFPEPDMKFKGLRELPISKCYWRKTTILKEIKRRRSDA